MRAYPLSRAAALCAVVLLEQAVPLAAADMPCDRFGRADAILVGVAQAPVHRLVRFAPHVAPVPHLVTPMTVERVFVGKPGAIVYLALPGPGLSLERGQTYLIYGERFDAEGQVLSPHYPLHTLGEAKDDLEFLESVAGADGATIRGRVVAGDPRDSSQPRVPLPGITIRLSSPSFAETVVTGEDGAFSVRGVPEGAVSIQAGLPDAYVALRTSVAARVGGCSEVQLVARLNGRIRGRVTRDDGGPTNWFVDLVPTDSRRANLSTHRLRERADSQGMFEFADLAPGEYLLAVNLLSPPRPYIPFETTYYPGTTERVHAIPIVVGKGTLHDGYELPLTARLRRGQFVVHIDSSVLGDARVCIRNMHNGSPSGGGMYTRFVPGTPVVVDVVERGAYRLWAHVEGQPAHAESDILDMIGPIGRQEVTLTLRPSTRSHEGDYPCDVPRPAQK